MWYLLHNIEIIIPLLTRLLIDRFSICQKSNHHTRKLENSPACNRSAAKPFPARNLQRLFIVWWRVRDWFRREFQTCVLFGFLQRPPKPENQNWTRNHQICPQSILRIMDDSSLTISSYTSITWISAAITFFQRKRAIHLTIELPWSIRKYI